MSGGQKAPRGASKEGQSSKRTRASGGSQYAGEQKFLDADDDELGTTESATKSTRSKTNNTGSKITVAAVEVQTRANKEKVERYRRDTRIRGRLAGWACIVVSTWLAAVFVLLCLPQFTDKNILSDAVLITLLSTTTLNVLGISFIVLNGYFKSHRSSGTSSD